MHILRLFCVGRLLEYWLVLIKTQHDNHVLIPLKQDFFDGIDRLLQQRTTPISEIVTKPNYTKSVLKRVLKEYNAKDVRRHVDALFKRVEKHYTDEDLPAKSAVLLKAVWMACEVEMVKCTERFVKIIALCYKDALGGSAGLEYSVQDVEAAFRKHRLNGQS